MYKEGQEIVVTERETESRGSDYKTWIVPIHSNCDGLNGGISPSTLDARQSTTYNDREISLENFINYFVMNHSNLIEEFVLTWTFS